MARTGLSFEQVEAAAKRVQARGERITLRSVRAELGEGSLTTIQRHLADFQGSGKRQTANKVDAALELPEKIVEAILGEIEAARSAAIEELQTELADLQADRDSLAAEVDRLTEALNEANEERAQAKGEVIAMGRTLAQYTLDCSVEIEKVRKDLGGKLELEREARHKAEIRATEQAGLAQRMQDVACELREQLAKLDGKAPGAKASSTPTAAKTLGVSTSRKTPGQLFINPKDASQTWTGKGKRPQWVSDWLDQGGTIVQLMADGGNEVGNG
ncbi:DNA-binding protein [Chitinolyticbacter meiyuanensis]|uniref:DNA-binding protein n=1 Tax=Chitinolyticbacter meiyuanensis TaxID=682798 RepID=UPI0011E5A6FB|nr:DNA-binding protein [Chitinolyticbacter meiyuanensis]